MTTRESERVLRRVLADAQTMARFWASVAPDPTPDGCREWAGTSVANARPVFNLGGRGVQPKRVAFSAARGVVAIGGKLVARCGNERCVEPAHMEWRTRPRQP